MSIFQDETLISDFNGLIVNRAGKMQDNSSHSKVES